MYPHGYYSLTVININDQRISVTVQNHKIRLHNCFSLNLDAHLKGKRKYKKHLKGSSEFKLKIKGFLFE